MLINNVSLLAVLKHGGTWIQPISSANGGGRAFCKLHNVLGIKADSLAGLLLVAGLQRRRSAFMSSPCAWVCFPRDLASGIWLVLVFFILEQIFIYCYLWSRMSRAVSHVLRVLLERIRYLWCKVQHRNCYPSHLEGPPWSWRKEQGKESQATYACLFGNTTGQINIQTVAL